MKKILIGDSLFEYLGDSDSYKNCAMAGDTTNGVLHRLYFIEEIEKADAIYLLVGVNDLLNGSSVDVLKSTYLNLIENILELNKNLKIVSLLPITQDFFSSEILIEHIKNFNRFLQRQSVSFHLQYIDAYNKLICQGFLCQNYSTDGLHLNKHGNEILKNSMGV